MVIRVVDVEPRPRGQGYVHQEDEAEDQECHKWLESHQQALVEDGHCGQPDVVTGLSVREAGRGYGEAGEVRVSLCVFKLAEAEQDAEENPDGVGD